ncbi:MAG: bifunctional diaminohydroxyphosphoribosylaminopyrimidine deaminase/5-amino-6-(5-phosphoribosylamino)uracil reductase RibD, partial [Spirochaetes bacterium]|nr:bifunctional diaminohydroxyphosphoribosylaminopyrimidine deaminase/5-amino-6-(5-phosphoribosylamino)uracil reductase RibD [Spirochaetota bacterium]
VTLEPCAHHGRTPPCTGAIRAAGIRRVHVALLDLNPAVAGKSRQILSEAGVETVYDCPGDLRREAFLLNRDFYHRQRHGRPRVTLKWAMTLDGKIAARTGDSRWVSSEASRERVQALRRHHDAVLVGGRTALFDDPELTVRVEPIPPTQALRIVLDRRGLTPPGHRLLTDAHATLFVVDGKTPPDFTARVAACGKDAWAMADADDLATLLARLARERELNSILVEGGSTVHSAFLDADLADGVDIFIAPKILGDGAGIPPIQPGIAREKMSQAMSIGEGTWEPLGPDIHFSGVVHPTSEEDLFRRVDPRD